MQCFRQVIELFHKESPRFAPQLKLIETFRAFTAKIPASDPHLFSLYVARHHPVQKIRHEDTFVGIGGAYRSKKEVEGFITAGELLLELQTRDITIGDIEQLNRLLSGKNGDAGAAIYSPGPSQVRKLHGSELLYTGAKPEDFQQGLACIIDQVNRPPQLHPLLHAALVHYLLVLLHPFSDGNGRTARMLTTLVMRRNGYEFGHEAYEQYYVWNSNQYQQALDFRGEFYTPGLNISKVQPWMAYFTQSLWKGSQEYFQARIYCLIAAIRAKIPGLRKAVYDLVCPAPAGVPLVIPGSYIRRYGAIGGKWAYTDANGNIIAWRVRFNGTAANKYEKSFLFFQYFNDNTWQYSPIQYKDVLPIYGLARITGNRNFLICEGEKCADSLRSVIGESEFTLLSWATGALQVTQTDWEPLGTTGANVYIWRDNDDVGKRAQDELATLLSGYGCNVYTLSDEALAAKPKGWDAADAIAQGMTSDEIKAFLKRHMLPAMSAYPSERTPAREGAADR